MSDLANRAEALLEGARARGAQDAEVLFATGDEFTVKVYQGQVESLESARSRGVGVRTFTGDRVGFAYGADVTAAGLEQLLEEALRNGTYNQADPANALPELQPAEPLPHLFASDFQDLDADGKVALAVELERRTISLDPRVKRCERTVYADGIDHLEIYNTRGLQAAFDRTTAYLVALAIAEAGEEMQQGYAFDCGRRGADLDLDRVAREASSRAAGLLGGKPVPTAQLPVVLDPLAAVSLWGLLSSAFSADAVQKARSLLAGKMGERIAAPVFNLFDDGRSSAGMASRPWDGEGVPTQRTQLVRDGVVNAYLFDTYTARKGNARSTGNARRSYRSQPSVGPTNLVLEPGAATREELLRAAEGGLHVTELSGLNTVNPTSGDFSLGATGFRIAGGSLGAPVREVTIAGNLLQMLQRITMIGNDLRWVFQVASPSVLIQDLAVGGV
jgi:PmbA protein